MTKTTNSHSTMRSMVCLLCIYKQKSFRKITGKTLEKVQSHFFENYDPNNINYPSHICSRCNTLLDQIEKGTKTTDDDLPNLIDLRQVKLPEHKIATRSSGSAENKIFCDCYICQEGRQNPGLKGQTKYVGLNKTPHDQGRPKHQGPNRLPDRKPVLVCDRCKSPWKKGNKHPENCGVTEFRHNMKDSLESDPKLKEVVTSEMIKEKANSAPNSPNISLATAGPSRQLTLKNPYTRSAAKRALFTNSPVPSSEVFKMKNSAGLNGLETQIVTKFV